MITFTQQTSPLSFHSQALLKNGTHTSMRLMAAHALRVHALRARMVRGQPRAMCLWAQVPASRASSQGLLTTPDRVHALAPGPHRRARRLTSVRHVLQQPGFRLHHIPVAEEDESPEVPLVIPLHVLHDVVPTQRAAVLVLHSPDTDVPPHRQEGHLEGQQGWARDTGSSKNRGNRSHSLVCGGGIPTPGSGRRQLLRFAIVLQFSSGPVKRPQKV